MIKLIKCPFCDEDGFDIYGLKYHLTGEGLLFSNGCQKFIDLSWPEEPEETP